MGLFNDFPYSNTHGLNLDWIVKTMKGVADETENLSERVKTLEESGVPIPEGEQGTTFTVAKNGAMFDTINGAIAAAREYITANPGKRVLVLIMDNNIYEENITLLNNPGIDIAGFGAIIRKDCAYPESPIYTTGRGTFVGLSFENYNTTTATNASYALHFDYNNSPAEGETHFVNCRFIAIGTHGAGIGLGNNIDLIFDNCFFRSTTHSGCYIHNSPFDAQSQIARFNNCQFYGLESESNPAFIAEDARTSAVVNSYASLYLANPQFVPEKVETRFADSLLGVEYIHSPFPWLNADNVLNVVCNVTGVTNLGLLGQRIVDTWQDTMVLIVKQNGMVRTQIAPFYGLIVTSVSSIDNPLVPFNLNSALLLRESITGSGVVEAQCSDDILADGVYISHGGGSFPLNVALYLFDVDN